MPGDYLCLKKDLKLPCDCVLVDGEAILNEECLTGESIPITK